MLPTLDQGWKSERGEISIRQGLIQSRALTHSPRAAAGAGRFRRRLPAYAPPHQFRKSFAAGFPLSPERTAYAPSDPRIQVSQHRWGLTETEIASPAPQVRGQFLYHFRRNFALQLLPARKAESQKLPLLRFRHRTLRLVHLELQLFRNESLHALHHPLPRPLAAHVDITVVRISHETMAASLQLPVEFVQHEVTQQRRKRTALWRPFHARAYQPVLHHPCIQECPDELQQPLVLHPFGDRTHQFVVVDSIEEFLQIEIHAPAVTFGDIPLRLCHCLLGAPSRSKTIAVFGKRRVPLLL